MAGGTYGSDISNYQQYLTDYAAMRSGGLDFTIILCSDGSWRQPYFRRQLDGCRAAGFTVAAYHYQRANVSVQAQIDAITAQVPVDVPVVIDVEDGSGVGVAGVNLTRALVSALRARGYRVPLSYIPYWYWSRPAATGLGYADLSGLPPLWVSWYPDYVTRSKEAGVAMLPASVWNGYGGLGVEIVQFTSSGRVPGYGSNVDLNYYRGSRAQLVALLGGGSGNDVGELVGQQAVQLQQLYDGASKPFVQNGRDFGEVIATQGRLWPDLDHAAMKAAGVQDPGDLSNAVVSTYALSYQVFLPMLQGMAKAVDALTTLVVEGDKARALEIRDAVREGLEDLLNARVTADVRVTLDPTASENEQVLTGEIVPAGEIEAASHELFDGVASETNNDGVRGGAAAPDGVGGPTVNDVTDERE